MTERSGIMLPYLYDEKRFNKYPKPCFVQPKLNGDRCRAVFDGKGKATLFSSGCKVRTSVPHIVEELNTLQLTNTERDGELYVLGMAHNQIRSIVSRTKNLHPNYTQMQYHIFDTIENNVEQHKRLACLHQMWRCFGEAKSLELVLTYDADNVKELLHAYQRFLDFGYEGIIIRHPYAFYSRSKVTTMMKLKPRLKGVFSIVGFTEEIALDGTPKTALGALTLQTPEGELFNVGSGFTRKQREEYWEVRHNLSGMYYADIRFQDYTTDRHVPNLLSFKKLVRR